MKIQRKNLTTVIFIALIIVLIIAFIVFNQKQKQLSVTIPQLNESTISSPLPTIQPEVFPSPTEQLEINQEAQHELNSIIDNDPSLDYMANEWIGTLADVYLQEVSSFNQSNLLEVSLTGQALAFAQTRIETYQNQNVQARLESIDYSEFIEIENGYQQDIVVEIKQSNQDICIDETQRINYFLNPQTNTWQIYGIEILNSQPSECIYF